jgi:hypothetical protein
VQQLEALSRLESLTLHSVSTLVPHSSSDDSASDSTSSDTDSDSDSSSGSDGGDDSDSGSDAYTDRFDGQFNGQKHPSVADTGELLQLLPQLTRLTHLDLFGLAKPAAPVPQWACLGRCTGLQVLRLQHLFMHKDSWGLMFAGAELRKLRELRLTAFHTFGVMSYTGHEPMPPQVVQQIVDACPNLEVLQLGGNSLVSKYYACMPEVREYPPVSLAPLPQLQHLTSLRVYSMRAQVNQSPSDI